MHRLIDYFPLSVGDGYFFIFKFTDFLSYNAAIRP